MKTIKLQTKMIEAAADAAGTTPEKFVSQIRSISLGRKVCAHLEKQDGDFSFFICA